MVKKVIDITIKQKVDKPVVKEKKKKKFKFKKPKFSLNWLFVLVSIILIIIIIGFVLSFKSKLTITIRPVLEEVNLKEAIEVSVSALEIDFDNKIIPGKFFETEEEKWNVFQSTGITEEGSKSEGIITVYNSHTPLRPIVLVEQTRFLSSSEGKIFKAQEKIILPAATMQGGKVIPSSVKVKIVAQDGGEDYNIPSSKFSVPGLSGSSLYYSVYAESDEPMKGGFESEVKVVTKEDLETAKQSLNEDLEEIGRASLERSIPFDFLLASSALLFEDFQASCFQEEGVVASEFNCYGKLKVTGLGFKKQDLNEIAVKFVTVQTPSTKKISQQSLETSFLTKGTITQGGSVILDLSVLAKVYKSLDEDVLLSHLTGLKKIEIQDFISSDYPSIKGSLLKFWPFWIRKAPKVTERIDIEWKLN